MKHSSAFLFATGLLMVASCHPKERAITLRAINKAPVSVEYLAFSDGEGQGGTARFVLPTGSSIRTQVKLKGRNDGDYRMHYKFAGSQDTLTQRFGYYTNGVPLEKELILRIEADTVLIKSIPFDSY
jgi:hypothetical protein